MTNWNSNTVAISKGTVVGTIEEVNPVDQADPVWGEAPVSDAAVRVCMSQSDEVEH